MIVFGQGGTAVEVVSDKALALPPLNLELARNLIGRTRVSRILKAYRNVPAADERAIELLLVKLAQLVADFPEIREIDLNPVLADETGVIAVDARVSLRRPKTPPGAFGNPVSQSGLIRRNRRGASSSGTGRRFLSVGSRRKTNRSTRRSSRGDARGCSAVASLRG